MKQFKGKVLFLDRSDINTDEIFPARYLTENAKEALQPFLLEDLALEGFNPGTDLHGKSVIIIEDIVDTGVTLEHTVDNLIIRNVKEISIVTLLLKPEAYRKNIHIDYVGFEIPNDFVVGYGLDYDGEGRNLPAVYSLVP